MSFDFVVRESVRADCAQLNELIRLHAREENEEVINSNDDLNVHAGYDDGQEKCYHCFVAQLQSSEILIGYLAYNVVYSSWDRCLVYVDKIYVRDRFQRKGVGLKLWTTLIQKMPELGCEKIHITCREDNVALSQFIIKNGCTDYTKKEGWKVYSLASDTFNGKDSS